MKRSEAITDQLVRLMTDQPMLIAGVNAVKTHSHAVPPYFSKHARQAQDVIA